MGAWAQVCEAVSELDEPPIRRCPLCSGLAYEVLGAYQCPRPRCGDVPVNTFPRAIRRDEYEALRRHDHAGPDGDGKAWVLALGESAATVLYKGVPIIEPTAAR